MDAPDIMLQVKNALKCDYGIPNPEIEWCKFGLANHDYWVSVQGEKRYFAKVHLGKTLEDIGLEEQAYLTISGLERELYKLGVGVPEIVKTKEGALNVSIEAPDGQRVLSIYKFIPGSDFGWPKGVDVEAQTRSLARAHRAAIADLQHVSIPEKYFPQKIAFDSILGEGWKAKLDWIEGYYTQGEEADAVDQLVALYHEVVPQLTAAQSEYRKLKLINIFADYHPFNARFDGERLVALIDFEFMHRNTLAAELVAPLQRIARTGREIIPENVQTNIELYMDAFLDGDDEFTRMAREQISWVPLLLLERLVMSGIYDLWSASQPEMQSGGLNSCKRNLALIDWVKENPYFLESYSG